MTKPESSQAYLLSTRLGWVGLSWARGVIHQLTFGHQDKQDAIHAMAKPFRICARRQLSEDQKQLTDRVLAFSEGAPDTFEEVVVRLDSQTEFQRAVLQRCREIPYGATCSYGELAKAAGRPKAARAVGSAMARNPIPLIIPCHRVVASNQKIGGFSAPGGLDMKRILLELEQGA